MRPNSAPDSICRRRTCALAPVIGRSVQNPHTGAAIRDDKSAPTAKARRVRPVECVAANRKRRYDSRMPKFAAGRDCRRALVVPALADRLLDACC